MLVGLELRELDFHSSSNLYLFCSLTSSGCQKVHRVGKSWKKPRRGAGSGPRYDIGILGVFWKSLAVIKGKGRFQGNDCKW